jgi:hypothetical protein
VGGLVMESYENIRKEVSAAVVRASCGNECVGMFTVTMLLKEIRCRDKRLERLLEASEDAEEAMKEAYREIAYLKNQIPSN